jgi:hypothetical protein
MNQGSGILAQTKMYGSMGYYGLSLLFSNANGKTLSRYVHFCKESLSEALRPYCSSLYESHLHTLSKPTSTIQTLAVASQ